MIDGNLVLVHGFWSSERTWDRLIRIFEGDPTFDGLHIRSFEYPSPKIPKLRFQPSRIPDFNDIAQMFASFLTAYAEPNRDVAIVTHSQGGLIVQRFLAWMIDEGRAAELAAIRLVVMLSCPNNGSEYLRAFRDALGFSAHPQAKSLSALNEEVAKAQRTVINRVVNARTRSDYERPIPFKVYAGGEDNVVTRASAQSVFPNVGTLPGTHSSILDPLAANHTTYKILRRDLVEAFDSRLRQDDLPPAVSLPADHSPRGDRTIDIQGGQGIQIGDNGTQNNTFRTN